MASKTLKVTIKQRYDTEANWTTNDPVLASGEIAFSSDKSCDYKVGDGSKKWSELSYQNASLYSSVLAAASQYSETAKKDNLGQQIDSTYIKTLSVSGATITYTKGDGTTTGSITVDASGVDFTGATSLLDGTAGRVPKPIAGKQTAFLKGNGAWSEISGSDITSGTIDDARLSTINVSATTSTGSPAHGGTFTAVDSITTDTKGRVTAVNTKTVTLPSNDNQNAFSNIKVGSDTIAADSSTDTFELVAGTNVTLTADTTNDKVTIASTDTDRYVNSATFADDSTDTAASPVKMTLTRAGSDSATVTANIPKVSSSSAGVAPKGASVTTQSQSTKFLREDGTWAAPSYTTATVNTDTYVSSASFADDSTDTAASPVKLTLSRSGDITSSVTANIPKVSSSSAGVAPKGAAVTTQSQSTKFLREDGTWAAPSYTTDTDTTYTFAGAADGITVTPSNGSATTYEVSSISASKISGVLSIDNIPAAALERVVTVANDTARFALTSNDVQLGDTVKVTATKKMYMVKDTSHLDTEAGYEEYVSSADWSTITNKPTTYSGYGLSVGSGLTGGSTGTIDHADTSSQSSITASSRTYVTAVTLDGFGHVTALSTGTETVTDTDRYVNSATFADDSTDTAASPVKMTLTRAGSDSATVTANIPKVSASSAGVAPKGASVTSQSQSTRFLREDGSWAAPSYTTNTDRYVNSAAFADDTTANANNPVKMTLTRSGSDSATVVGNLPKVSASSAGVVPKGASVTSQSQSTKFLREDGSWEAPSYTTNTDRYVNSAAFADDTTANSSSPLKMTLTRAGSDSATVTGNLPKVSADTAGIVPKGASVTTQSTSTKFLREDGTWAAPSYPAATVDTWRGINLEGSSILGTGNDTGSLNFSAGTGVTITNSSGTLTFGLDASSIPAPATVDGSVD